MSTSALLAPERADAPEPGLTSDADGARTWWRTVAYHLAGLVVFFAVLAWRFPRFFYIDDKQLQYLPVFRWLGQQPGLRPPLVDPDQGMAGNFAADPQYGVFDPAHWVVYRIVSATGNMNLAAWAISVGAIAVLGLGVCALTSTYRVRPAWGASAALAAATSGWLLYVGASWWPMVWGTAWLPWLWWGMVAGRRWAPAVAAVSGYLLVSSGYPYALPFALAIVVGVLIERLVQARWDARSGLQALSGRRPLAAFVAAAGGGLAGTTGILVAGGVQEISQRTGAVSPPLGNAGTFVANAMDVLLGGLTLQGSVDGWWGELITLPVMSAGWFAVPLLGLVRWRSALRGPGVVTTLIVAVFSFVATQTPTEIGSLRFPVRYLADLQLVLPLLTVLLLRQGLAVGRRHLLAAAGLVVAQLLVAIARTPALSGWHLAAAVAVLACGAALVVLVRGQARPAPARAGRVGVAALLVLGSAVLPVLGGLTASAASEAVTGEEGSFPRLGPHDSGEWPTLIDGFEAAAWEDDLNATALVWGDAGPDLGLLSTGVPLGSAGLFSGMRLGYGYTSVGQLAWADRWCNDYLGQVGTCGDAADRLSAIAPGTDVSWLEVMSKDTVLLSRSVPAALRDQLLTSGRWTVTDERNGSTRVERTQARPGRSTWNSDGVFLTAGEVGPEQQTYRVDVDSAEDQTVVFRDTWWPGYHATLDGEEVPTTALDGTVVQVTLPAGRYSEELTVTYRPDGLGLGLVAVGVGAAIAVVGVLLGWRPDRRRRRRPATVDEPDVVPAS